jgi:hypothetical protein
LPCSFASASAATSCEHLSRHVTSLADFDLDELGRELKAFAQSRKDNIVGKLLAYDLAPN